ncbi:MAG: TAXI family TRAP transporter solute-binding subunit [Rubrivivax sp.]|nr:TAXI family TRAP transporter solute-binding subunit [Rubrivivax sp.]
MVLASACPGALAQQHFRIGTGGTGGTYYPVGVQIAAAVSQPGRIVVSAQPSNGSLGNVIGVASGSLESGFSQADIATWAQTGTGTFEGKPPLTRLRLIANLFSESIHVVVRKDSPIQRVSELRGQRVALDEVGSGSLISARMVLAAHGLKESDLRPEYIKPNQAADRLLAGQLDAFFFTGGVPAKAVADLAASAAGIRLLPLEGEAARRLRSQSPFLAEDTVPAGAYAGVPATATLAVGAQWVTDERASPDLVYEITKALYSEPAQKALASGHPKGASITLANAVRGAGIPFHEGARRFYREAGVLK